MNLKHLRDGIRHRSACQASKRRGGSGAEAADDSERVRVVLSALLAGRLDLDRCRLHVPFSRHGLEHLVQPLHLEDAAGLSRGDVGVFFFGARAGVLGRKRVFVCHLPCYYRRSIFRRV